MADRRSLIVVLLLLTSCGAVPVSELLDRICQRSDKLHSLSTTLSHELESHFPPMARVFTPRPSTCHTSSLATPNDKTQALQVSESDLVSLSRSLLAAWSDPLSVLTTCARALPPPVLSSVLHQVRELQERTRSLEDGLDVLSNKMGPAAQVLFFLPFRGNDVGHDRVSKLIHFHFLLSCFRRDSHKIDSFLKVLRCRATGPAPDLC